MLVLAQKGFSGNVSEIPFHLFLSRPAMGRWRLYTHEDIFQMPFGDPGQARKQPRGGRPRYDRYKMPSRRSGKWNTKSRPKALTPPPPLRGRIILSMLLRVEMRSKAAGFLFGINFYYGIEKHKADYASPLQTQTETRPKSLRAKPPSSLHPNT